MRVFIVGGSGYIGFHIGVQLVRRGHTVFLYDLQAPDPEWLEDYDPEYHSMTLVKGSVVSLPNLVEAFILAQVDGVIHCASYGMSGIEQLPTAWDHTEAVNVGGTVNVIKACIKAGVKSLVYTSTVNVVFGGQEIINGDENSLPYYPLHRHVDHYSRTKAVAEQLVIMADGKQHKNGHLRTCALRLAGVFGVKEKRHQPRIVSQLPPLKFMYGPEALSNFVSIENVCQAHVKALEALNAKPEVLGGEPYFINDGAPIQTFEFYRPLIEGLGYPFPKMILPLWFMWIIVYIIQFTNLFVHWINPNWCFNPYLTPCELVKTSATHYFSTDKAKRDFDFIPQNPNDLSAAVKYFQNKQQINGYK